MQKLGCRYDIRVFASEKVGEIKNSLVHIDSQTALVKAVIHLEGCSEIALDLEFDRERYSYGFTLCLIQIQGKECSYVVDPTTISDLSPLFRLFEEESILKVLHSPSEDLRLLHLRNCFPKNIFDTETAAKLLNFSAVSLSALLSNCLNVDLDKSLQRSNWNKRPLSHEQIKYAANDVLYLLPLRDHLVKLAHDKPYDAIEWIRAENQLWEEFRARNASSEDAFLSGDERRRLSPYNKILLNGLLAVRDKYASLKNLPSHFVISKDALMDIAFGDEGDVAKYVKDNPKNVHPLMRSVDVQREFQNSLMRSRDAAQAKGFHPPPPKNSPERKLARHKNDLEKLRIDTILAKTFIPVHDVLVKRYGKHVADFIISRTAMTKIATKELLFEDLPGDYRKILIKEIIRDKQLDDW